MSRVALYCRLSDEDNNKRNINDDSESIQNQKNMLMKYALERNWDIYNIYSDDDYSGLDNKRPEFNKMLQDAEQKKFDIILCKTQSRFTRDMELVEKYLHKKFLEWGIRFITVVDGVDTLDKNNKKSRQIHGLINEWYSEDTSESIRAVFNLKQKTGKFIGSFACYGFTKDPQNRNKLIIDVEAAEVVKLIFNLYLQGFGVQSIANKLNKIGICNPTTYKKSKGLNYVNASAKDNLELWNKVTIKRILKNEAYIGKMVQHKRTKLHYKSDRIINLPPNKWIKVDNTHEPIISEDIFNLVQKRLQSKVKSSGGGTMHVFSGKVKCMTCKSTMVKSGNGDKYQYLRCKLYSLSKSEQLCTSHSIRLDLLEKIVIDKLKDHIDSLIDDDSIVMELNKESKDSSQTQSLNQEIYKINRDIQVRDEAIKNLYLDKTRGIVSSSQFLSLTRTYEEEKDILALRKARIEDLIKNEHAKDSKIKAMCSDIQKYKENISLNHFIANKFIDCIEIGEYDKALGYQSIKIYWNF